MLDREQKHYASKLASFYPFSAKQIVDLLNEVVPSGLNMEEAIAVVKDFELYEAEVVQLREENKYLKVKIHDLIEDIDMLNDSGWE